MEISILKKYNDNKAHLDKHRLQNPEGKTVEAIEELEQLFNQGNSFPKVFREFLFIGGKYNGLGINSPIDGVYDRITKKGKLRMQERGIQINRPFIIYHSFEGKVFSFIYLDEGDDPQPWNVSVDEAYDTDEGEYLWKTPFATFSEKINYLVDNALKGLQPF